jgi:hypothetical protein
LTDGFSHYPYRFDTNALGVEVVRGGKAGPVRPIADGYFAVDIELTHSLQAGQTASFEYQTQFAYREPPPPEFRRGAVYPIHNLELYVQFDSAKLPARVWWAEWDDYRPGAKVQDREEVSLDTEHAVHRYLPLVEQGVVGFYWKW